MRQFFKYVFATMVGITLSTVLSFVFFGVVVGGIIASTSSKKETTLDNHSVLRLTFSGNIAEQGEDDDALGKFFSKRFQGGSKMGLNTLLANIAHAKTDDNIKGIYLDLSFMAGNGFSTLESVRRALLDFKTSKKFIYAYSKVYSQGGYYLASTADSVFLSPVGELALTGLNAQTMFYKRALDRLGIVPEVIRVGKFKSAVEPYTTDHMSDASRAQTKELIDGLWQEFLAGISASRKIPVEKLQQIADGLLVRNAKSAVAYGLADRLTYEEQARAAVKRQAGIKPEDDLETVTLSDYAGSWEQPSAKADRIAVVYLQGEIVDGSGNDGQIGSTDAIKAIEKAAKDAKVKAIVLRVNSPGGSALASDEIWHAAMVAKTKKPLVVSMGDYAASGGYYIAAAGDSILAERTTITGSIGVFGIIPTADKFLSDKLGITFDGVKTGAFADLALPTKPLSAPERAIIQQGVNETYATFLSRVGAGRHMDTAKVSEIAQGRVWQATKAKQLGLVDRLGSLNDAIAVAAKLAKTTDYSLKELPNQKSMIDRFMSDVEMSLNMVFNMRAASSNPIDFIAAQLKSVLGAKGILAMNYITVSL